MSNILKIYTHPNSILRKKSVKIDIEKLDSQKFQEFCFDLASTMQKKDGAGLAAPQVGKNIRLIAINSVDGSIIMINPRITKKSWAKEWDMEGCLSVPNTFGKVRRHKKIKYVYCNNTGDQKSMEAKGLMARIIQHEFDHLDGILFIDKAKNITKN